MHEEKQTMVRALAMELHRALASPLCLLPDPMAATLPFPAPKHHPLPPLLFPRSSFLVGACILPAMSNSNTIQQAPHTFQTRAAAKREKPPPKPANTTTILAAIFVPLLLAASAVFGGFLLLRKLRREAMEEALEMERRFNPARLLTDGSEKNRTTTTETEPKESVTVVETRNRPKREE